MKGPEKVTAKGPEGNLILEVKKDTETPLWLVPINEHPLTEYNPTKSPDHSRESTTFWRKIRGLRPMRPHIAHFANSAYHQCTIPNLVAYLHACLGYVPMVTWLKAINLGWFMTWPGITAAAVQKYLPKIEAKVMGRLKKARQGIQPSINEEDLNPLLPPSRVKFFSW